MSDLEADAVHERVRKMLSQVPTLAQALGCANCAKIFRVGGECPYCESTSIFNLAKYLEQKPTLAGAEPKTESEEQ